MRIGHQGGAGEIADIIKRLFHVANDIPRRELTAFAACDNVFNYATQEGAKVIPVGQSDFSISILVVYPELVENYTFLLSSRGPEVIWTSNKHSSAYRAACSFVNLPKN